jgi:gas vesicle protein
MAFGSTAGTVWIDIRARMDQFGQDLDKATSSQKLKQVGANMTKALTLPIIGAGALAIKELMEVEKVNAQTEAALKSTGGAANVTAGDIRGLADRMQELTAVDAEQVQSAQNVLLTFTKVRNEVGKGNNIFDQGTKAALNMSAALGTDLQGATLQIGKALNDPIKGVTALGRAGVQFTEQQKEQIKAMTESGNALGAQKMILKELETQFGGSAKAAGDTFGGQLKKLMFSLEDAGASLAKVLMPALKSTAEFLGRLADAFGNLSPGAQKFILVAAGVVAAIGPVLSIIDKLKTALLFLAANPIVLLIAAVVGLVVLIVKNWDKIKEATRELKEKLAELWNNIKEKIGEVWDNIKEKIANAWENIKDKVANAVDNVRDKIANVWTDIKESVANAVERVRENLGNAWDNIREKVGNVWQTIKEKLGDAWDKIKEVVSNGVEKIIQWFGDLPGNIVKALGNLGRLLYQKGKDLVGGFFEGIKDNAQNLSGGISGMVARAVGGILDGGGGGLGAGNLGGDLVTIGRNLQAQGFRVSEHPAFGGVNSHTAGSYHYVGRAIDVNWGTPGQSAEEMAVLTALGMKLKATTKGLVELLGPWNDPNHKDHLHIAMDQGGTVRGPATVHIGNIREDVQFIPRSGPYAVPLPAGRSTTFNVQVSGPDAVAVVREMEERTRRHSLMQSLSYG